MGTLAPKTFRGQLCGTFGVTVVLGNDGQQLARELLAKGFQEAFHTGGFCHETVAQSTGHHFPAALSGLLDQLRSIAAALACGPSAHKDDIDASLEAS